MICRLNPLKRLSSYWQISEQECDLHRNEDATYKGVGMPLTREWGCDLAESIPMSQNLQVARRQVAVTNVLGLHMRAADEFVKLANSFQSDVNVCCNGVVANGKSILSLLSLAAECGIMLALEA